MLTVESALSRALSLTNVMRAASAADELDIADIHAVSGMLGELLESAIEATSVGRGDEAFSG